MPERRLEIEDIDSPLHSVCGIAVPHWCGGRETLPPSPLSTDLSNRLAVRCPSLRGSEIHSLSFAAAKR